MASSTTCGSRLRNSKSFCSATLNTSAFTLAYGRSFTSDGLLLGQTFGNALTDTRVYNTQGRLREQCGRLG